MKVNRVDPREWSEHDPEIEDILRPIPREDPRGFWARLFSSLRGKAVVKKDGNISAELTGGATFLNCRPVTEADAWREVNRPFVAAAVTLILFLLACGALAFILSSCVNLGPQRVAWDRPVAEIPAEYR